MAITAVTPDLVSRLTGIFTQIGLDHKDLQAAHTLLQTKQGDITQLTTGDKSSVVGALNSIQSAFDSLVMGAQLDDTVTDTATGWSSSKIASAISDAVAAVVDSAPGALDTLAELSSALQNNPDIVQNIMDVLGKVVRVDIAQAFTVAEKAMGRNNIGAASEADLTQMAANVGDISTLDLTVYTGPRDGTGAFA